MSLPATTADISANPTKMGVTAPVNSANKDADVARKLKLLGVVQVSPAAPHPSATDVSGIP